MASDKQISVDGGSRFLSALSVLIVVMWLGHCGGLVAIRKEACIYKTGNPECRRAEVD